MNFARTIVSHGVAELPPNRVDLAGRVPTVFEDVVETICTPIRRTSAGPSETD